MIEFRQKEFANFLGAKFQKKLLEHNLNKAVHGYGKKNNGRLSQREKEGEKAVETFNNAVEKIRKKKLAKIDKRAQTTIGQDLKRVVKKLDLKKVPKKTIDKISEFDDKARKAYWDLHGDRINEPSEVHKKFNKAAKNFYENTDEVVTKTSRSIGKGLGKTARFIKNEPAMAAGKLVIGPAGKAAAFAISPSVGAAVAASPVGPGTIAGALGSGIQHLATPSKKVVPITKTVKKQRPKVDMWGKPTGKMETYRDKEVVGYGTKRSKKAIEGKRLEDSFTDAFTPKFKKRWSIQRGVRAIDGGVQAVKDNVKSGVQSVRTGTERLGQLFRPRREVVSA